MENDRCCLTRSVLVSIYAAEDRGDFFIFEWQMMTSAAVYGVCVAGIAEIVDKPWCWNEYFWWIYIKYKTVDTMLQWILYEVYSMCNLGCVNIYRRRLLSRIFLLRLVWTVNSE